MTEYLFSRVDGAPPADMPFDEFGIPIFFQMWITRQDPYAVLANGDTLWWTDQQTREIRWELRIANLRRTQYRSVPQALDRLRRWFGLMPSDLNDYSHSAPGSGWLLAWQNDVVSPVGTELPHGTRLGRNGFRRLEPEDARALGLPEPGRLALNAVEVDDAEDELLAPPRTRHIPLATRRAVFARANRRCQMCATGDGSMHVDHIFPWSRGGSNDLANLQLLCAPCNLAKAARVVGDVPVMPAMPELVRAARLVSVAVPQTPIDLRMLLSRCVHVGEAETALEVAWAIYHHPDVDGITLSEVNDGLLNVERPWAEHVALFRAITDPEPQPGLLTEFANSDDGVISTRAAAALIEFVPQEIGDLGPYIDLARQSPDARIRAIGSLAFANATDRDDERYDEWHEAIQDAINLGDAETSAMASFMYGSQIGSDVESYGHLERATRSSNRSLAAEAARMLARRFSGDADVASVFQAMADELDGQLGATK